MPVIPAVETLKQEDHCKTGLHSDFKPSLNYIVNKINWYRLNLSSKTFTLE